MNKLNLNIKFEELTNANLISLTEMTIELWPECDFDEEKNNWKELISDRSHFVQLAKLDAGCVGFIHASIRHEYVEGNDFDSVAYLEGIYIRSAYRNQGIARQLLINTEKWAKSKGLNQIASDTEITNTISQDFHQKSGFSEVNRIVCFIKNI